MGLPLEHSAGLGFVNPTPLLEEKRHSLTPAMVAQFENPLRLHRASPSTAFTADNNPMDPVKIDRPKTLQQRLHG